LHIFYLKTSDNWYRGLPIKVIFREKRYKRGIGKKIGGRGVCGEWQCHSLCFY